MNTTQKPDRVLLWGAVAVAVIVIAAAVAALAGSGPTSYAEGSPEAAAQRYVQAVLDDDVATVESLQANSSCRVSGRFFRDDSVRVRLLETTVDGTNAVVEIEVVHIDTSPFLDGSRWEERGDIRLTDTESGWMVSDDSWPYWPCEEQA